MANGNGRPWWEEATEDVGQWWEENKPPTPTWFNRVADWANQMVTPVEQRVSEAWQRPRDLARGATPQPWFTPSPLQGVAPEDRYAAWMQNQQEMAKQPGTRIWRNITAQPNLAGDIATGAEQALSAAGQLLQEPAEATEAMLGSAVLATDPRLRDRPVSEWYPLGQDFYSWTLEEAKHTLGGKQGERPLDRGVREVREGRPAEEVAAEIRNPWAKMVGQSLLDPLNIIDIAQPTEAIQAAQAAQKAERQYVRAAQRATEAEQQIDRALDVARGMDRATRPAEQPGRLQQLFGNWDEFKRAINPLEPTAEARAAADQADTYQVVANLVEDADDAQDALTRLEMFRTNPTEAAKVYGQFLGSEKGRRVADTLRQVDLDKLEWAAGGRPFSGQALAMELHDRTRPLLDELHGVTEPTGYRKLAKAFKGLASEFYMNLNPGYAIRNALNNAVTLAWDGLLAMDSQADIDRYLAEVGAIPSRVARGIGGPQAEFAGQTSRLPGALGQLSEAGGALARSSPIGEEAWYKRGFASALRRTLAQTWHSGRQVPAPPAEVWQALGPRGAADLVSAVASGKSPEQIVANVQRVLTPRQPGDTLAFVVRYLDPEQLDYLSPAAVAYLEERIMGARSPEDVSQAIAEVRAALQQQGDSAYRREILDPNRRRFTEVATTEALDQFVDDLIKDAKLIGLDDAQAQQLADGFKMRWQRWQDELNNATGEMMQAAAATGNRDAVELAYQANRRQAELQQETRRIVDEARREAWAQMERDLSAAQVNAVWDNYFTLATREWERNFSERLATVEQARANLERLGAGVGLDEMLEGGARQLAEERLARQAALAKKAGEKLPEIGSDAWRRLDFDKKLDIHRSRVDLAHENAWRLAFQSPDQDTLDILESAYRYEQDVGRKWRAERDALRNAARERWQKLPRKGKSKEELKDLVAELRRDIAQEQDELAELRFGQQQRRWEIAEEEIRAHMAGEDVLPPERPKIDAPTPFARQEPPENLTPAEAARWEHDELAHEFQITYDDMLAGRRPRDNAALADLLDRMRVAREKAAVEARRALGDLAEATHTQIRPLENRQWAVDVYKDRAVIKTETFDTFKAAKERQQTLELATRPPVAPDQSMGARMAIADEMATDIDKEVQQVRDWATRAGDQGATGAKVRWDRNAKEWMVEFTTDEEPARIIASYPMGRRKDEATRAADLANQVLEGAPVERRPSVAQGLSDEQISELRQFIEESESEKAAAELGSLEDVDEVPFDEAPAVAKTPEDVDAEIAAEFEEARRLQEMKRPRSLEEAAQVWQGRRLEELGESEMAQLVERLQAEAQDAAELSNPAGLEALLHERVKVEWGEYFGESMQLTGRARRDREAYKWQVIDELVPEPGLTKAEKEATYYERQGELADWYQELATEAAERMVQAPANPRTPPEWLQRPTGVAEAGATYTPYTPRTEAPEFKRWFGQSKIVDPLTGQPLELYHGTTKVFDEFDPTFTNVDNYLGQGIYLSDNPADASRNYAGMGPDLTSRLQHEADQIAENLYMDPDPYMEMLAEIRGTTVDELWDKYDVGRLAIDDDEALELAKALHMEHEGAVLPVNVRMENPLYLRPRGGTRFSLERHVDEWEAVEAAREYFSQAPEDFVDDLADLRGVDYEELEDALEAGTLELTDDEAIQLFDRGAWQVDEGLAMLGTEPRWLLVDDTTGHTADLIEVGESLQWEYGLDENPLVSLMEQQGWELYQMPAQEFFEEFQRVPVVLNAEGEYAGDYHVLTNQITGELAQALGYDGVVMDAGAAFVHMEETAGTSHYIVWQPHQVKSVFNRAPTDDPGLLREAAAAVTTTDQRPLQHLKLPELLDELEKTGFVPASWAAEAMGRQQPEHLQAVIDYLRRRRQTWLEGELTPRTVAKAMVINTMSQRAGEMKAATFFGKLDEFVIPRFDIPDHFWLDIDGERWIRPEDAAAAWLFSPTGQKALDALDAGKFDAKAWAQLEDLRRSWGANTFYHHGTMDPKKARIGNYNLHNIHEFTERLNEAGRRLADGTGSLSEIQEIVSQAAGVGPAKVGFLQHLLGMGDTPTFDAVEINFWLTGQGDISALRNKQAQLALELKSRFGKATGQWFSENLWKRFEELATDFGIGETLEPEIFGHVMHHWLWDAAKGTKTTHAGIYQAVELAEQGMDWAAEVRMGDELRQALAADLPEWPDPTGAQLSFAKYESPAGQQVGLDGKLEPAYGYAKRYQRQLVERGFIDFRGQKVSRQVEEQARDLAELFRIYRDPDMETFRLIYIKDNQIVAHEALTSGHIDSVLPFRRGRESQFVYDIRNRIQRLEADGVFMMHNHPSGRPNPSGGDMVFTENLAREIPEAKGHIIIDGDEFYFIPIRQLEEGTIVGAPMGRAYPTGPQEAPFEAAGVEATDPGLEIYLGTGSMYSLTSPGKIAEWAKGLIDRNSIAVVHLNMSLQVTGIEVRPVSWLDKPRAMWQTLAQKQKEFSAVKSALIVDPKYEGQLRRVMRDRWAVPIEGDPQVMDALLMRWPEMKYRSAAEEGWTPYPTVPTDAKARRLFEQPVMSQWALDEATKTLDEAARKVENLRANIGETGEPGKITKYQWDKLREEAKEARARLEDYIEQAQAAELDTSKAEAALQAVTESGRQRNPVTVNRSQPNAAEFPTLVELTRHVEPRALEALDAVEAGVRGDWERWQGFQADAQTQAAVQQWLDGQVLPRFRDARVAAMKGAEEITDRAMLNYADKNRLDELLSLVFPYHFWYTRSAGNWARRLAQNPNRLATYLRYKERMRELNQERGLRERYEGRWRIPAPEGMLPEWTDQSLYVDPTQYLFPFATFDRVDWDDPDTAQNALTTLYQGATGAGFRPYAFLELPIAYTEQLGESRENIGDIIPQTAALRGATAVAGMGPAGGVELEAPLRRAAGLQEQGPWDPYRVSRMLSSMAGDDPQLALAVMRAQELQQRVTNGELDLRQATGEEPAGAALQGIASEYNWTPEQAAEAQDLLREAVTRAGQERGISAVASFGGVPASVLATGEQRQLELQREGREQVWSPEQPGGSREQYESWRSEHPEQYSRSMGYQVLPGETPSDWWTPGTAANVVGRRQGKDAIIADYQQQIDQVLREDPTNDYEASRLQDEMYAALDEVEAQYPVAESGEDIPAAKYGQTPAEYGQAVLERELYDLQETLPQYTDFANGADYRAALELALASLPESTTALELAQRSGGTRALTLREAYESWRRRYDSPLQAVARTYWDTIYWPTMDKYRGLVTGGTDKGKAWDQTMGALPGMQGAELIDQVLERYPDQGWTAESLAAEVQGVEFPAGEIAGRGRQSPDERGFWQAIDLVPWTADIRDDPAVALVLDSKTRDTATPEQITAARVALEGWLAENPDARQAVEEAEQLATEANERWPGIKGLESAYFDLSKAERRQFLDEHPELKAYWDYKDAFKASHPVYTKFYDPDFDATKAKGDGRRKAEAQREPYVYKPGAPWWSSYKRSYGGGGYGGGRSYPTWRRPTWYRPIVRAGL